MDKNYFWGFFFLFVQFVAILRNYVGHYNYYFWFCDFAPLLFSISFFIKNRTLVKGLINFGLIPQVIFLIDFIHATYAGSSLLGVRVDLLNINSFTILSTIFVHFTTLIALGITFRIKPTKKTWIYSIIFMSAVYFAMLLFTSPNGDINYVYSTGNLLNSMNFTIPNITFFWPFLAFLLVILPTQAIQYGLYKIFRNKTKEKS